MMRRRKGKGKGKRRMLTIRLTLAPTLPIPIRLHALSGSAGVRVLTLSLRVVVSHSNSNFSTPPVSFHLILFFDQLRNQLLDGGMCLTYGVNVFDVQEIDTRLTYVTTTFGVGRGIPHLMLIPGTECRLTYRIQASTLPLLTNHSICSSCCRDVSVGSQSLRATRTVHKIRHCRLDQ